MSGTANLPPPTTQPFGHPPGSWLRDALFLPPQGSSVAPGLDHLHEFVILTTLAGGAFVFGLGLYFCVRYRKREDDAITQRVVASRALELLYIFGPLALFLLWFFIGFTQYIHLDTPPRDAMDVYVTAKQWMWKFTYPDGPSAIGTLRVPVGRPVRLLITSRDVIHSFFVPAFRLKKDAVPGRYTQMWFTATTPGRYRVECAEYCGIGHSDMYAEVWALDPTEFDRWMAEQRKGLVSTRDASPSDREPVDTGSSLSAQGERLAVTLGCARCHTVDGSPHIGPTWKDLYMRTERLADGSTVVADEAYLTESMMEPGAKIVAGYRNVMPSYQGRMDAGQAAAVVEYIKSLRAPGVDRVESKGPTFEPRH